MKLTERRSAAQNNSLDIIARKLRVQRVQLFSRLAQAHRDLKGIMGPIADDLSSWVVTHGSPKDVRGINERIRQHMIVMRRDLKSWLLKAVKDSTKMSLQHAQNALGPIFENNKEAARDLLVGAALVEARLSFVMDAKFAARNTASIVMSSDKWQGTQSKIVKRIASGSIEGLNPSDRIWELVRNTEAQLKRLVVTGIASGENPAAIASRIKKYISPAQTTFADSLGPGIYKSPFKNAMRLARTETIKAYNHATAEFAKDKAWAKGIQVRLSPNHPEPDECDAYDGQIMDPEDFAATFPLHPHCFCIGVYVIDPKYLGEA